MKNIRDVEKSQRVVTFLNRKEVDFLDKLGKDALFSTGFKLSRAKLIAWLVEFTKELNINGKGIKSIWDFENRVKESIPHQPQRVNKGRCAMNIKQIATICLIMISLFIDLSFAQDNVSFSMSLTIPAIPGLNAPPYENQVKNTESTAGEKQETAETQDEIKTTAQVQTTAVTGQGSEKTVQNEEKDVPVIQEINYIR